MRDRAIHVIPQFPRIISNFIEIILARGNHFYIYRNMEQSTAPLPALTLAADSFAALGSEQRLMVLRCLVRAGPDGLSIGALGKRAGVSGSTLTHHLKLLAATGLVKQTRAGRSTICAAVAYEEVQALAQFLLQECCADGERPDEDHQHG